MSTPTAHQQPAPAGFPPPRDLAQRRRDAEDLLRSETTGWVATSGPRGPHLVPLLFVWGGARLTMATADGSATVANLRRHPRARIAVGHPYDLVMIDATAEPIPAPRIDQATGDAFAALLHGGPDPRATPGYSYIQATPVRVQAWRNLGELQGRTLMRHGGWLTP